MDLSSVCVTPIFNVSTIDTTKTAFEAHAPRVIQEIENTSVLGLHYRTEIREKWR